jgi:uncharacterized protein with FMN-binding domain
VKPGKHGRPDWRYYTQARHDHLQREVTLLVPRKPAAPKEGGGSSGRIANRLVALSSAAVLAVYSAGYLRTRTAADRLQAAERPRVVIPAAAPFAPPLATPAAMAVAAPASGTSAAVPAASTPAARSSASTPAAAPAKSPKPATKAVSSATTSSPSPTPVETAASAATPTPTPVVDPTPAPAPAPQWKDGTFSGWGTSRHGDIEATVVIEAGRIVNAYISQCWTRYSCSWVAHLQGQVVTRQSPEVDYVSGATQSANAFYYAVVQALSKAK